MLSPTHQMFLWNIKNHHITLNLLLVIKGIALINKAEQAFIAMQAGQGAIIYIPVSDKNYLFFTNIIWEKIIRFDRYLVPYRK